MLQWHELFLFLDEETNDGMNIISQYLSTLNYSEISKIGNLEPHILIGFGSDQVHGLPMQIQECI